MPAPLAQPLTTALRRWALRRQGPDRLPLALAARRVYILPTGAGWTFGLLVGVMFLAGMNYGNGLALLFAFWLAGFALVAMIRTQRVLAGTRLLAATATPVFAGEAVPLRLQLQCAGDPRELEARAEGDDRNGDRQAASAVAAPDGTLRLDVPAARRGRWRAPTVHLQSTAPFGLFRTWTWLDLDVTSVVYPAPGGDRPEPETASADSGASRQEPGQEELAWLRDFREGDSPRQVAWKAYAKGAPLLVREYRGQGSQRRELDFATLAPLDVEARLSQLTQWLTAAAARGDTWTLRLPGHSPLSGTGHANLPEALTRLALHDMPGAPP